MHYFSVNARQNDGVETGTILHYHNNTYISCLHIALNIFPVLNIFYDNRKNIRIATPNEHLVNSITLQEFFHSLQFCGIKYQ